jgi:hypothetical protein
VGGKDGVPHHSQGLSVEALNLFIRKWQRTDGQTQLETLLQELPGLLRTANKTGSARVIDEGRFQNLGALALHLQQTFTHAFEAGDFFNVWSVSGLGRDEVQNSAILAWLFDRYGSHGQRQGFLKQFLYRLREILPESLKNVNWIDSAYFVRKEVYPLGILENRIDVEIDSEDSLILIETKIDAPEGKSQLRRYQELAREKAKQRPYVVIYLCVSRRRDVSEAVSATWNDVAVAIKDYLNLPSSKGLAPSLVISLQQLANHWRLLR